jgi:hypothetical protein
MTPYHCRKCKRFLFESDATEGRVRLTCRYRDCKTAQMVFLGGHFKARENEQRGQPFDRPRLLA